MFLKSNFSGCIVLICTRHFLNLIFFFTLIGLASCKKETASLTASIATVSTADVASPQLNATKFGAMLGGNITMPAKNTGLLLLKVNYVRSAIILNQFNGTSDPIGRYLDSGFKVLLNLNYGQINNDTAGSKLAVPFPTDMVEYRKQVNAVLNKYNNPEVVIIENEPTTYHFHSGPMSDYITELKTAVGICKNRGLKVTDGGISAQVVDVIRRGIGNYSQKIADTRTLLAAYKTIPLDYVNIHFHAPFTTKDSPDSLPPGTLDSIVNYITRVTGKPVICTEYNQRNSSTLLMNNVVKQAVESNLKYFIARSENASGDDRSLFDGTNLSKTGISYRNAIKQYNY